MDQNTLHCCYDEYVAINQQTHFQRLVKIYYLSLNFLKAWQSVLIRKIKLLNFSFITTTLLDFLDKNSYQHNTS